MTYEEAKHIVAVRHKLGTTLVTGHKAAYFEEAARMYAENEIYAAVHNLPIHVYWQVRHHFGLPVELKDDNLYYLESIFLKDEDGEGGTIFFKELPGIIAQGDTYEEALRNLYDVVKFHFANP